MTTSEPHEIVLDGCAPVPLAGYLKALGVFRLIAEQADTEARGFWRNERFVLRTRFPERRTRALFPERIQAYARHKPLEWWKRFLFSGGQDQGEGPDYGEEDQDWRSG